MTAHEQYQLLVGEIGIPRKEYLYELQLWEIILITRGYWRRQHPSWEQSRLIAYNVRYCMGVPKGQSPVDLQEWLPFPWEGNTGQNDVSEDDVQDILASIREENRKNGF